MLLAANILQMLIYYNSKNLKFNPVTIDDDYYSIENIKQLTNIIFFNYYFIIFICVLSKN